MKSRLLPLVLLAAAVGAVFLARWQFERAAQKRALQESFAEAAAAPPLDVAANISLNPPADFVYRRAAAVGRFIPDGEILIDNRVHNRRPGYLAVTPLALGADDAGATIMVDRGWLAAAANRSRPPLIPPPPSGVVTVRGVLLPDDEGALELSAEIVDGKVWQNLHLQKYAAQTGREVLPLFLRADDSADSDLPMLPARPRLTPERNTAYAWQWLALAAVAAVFAALLFLRRDK